MNRFEVIIFLKNGLIDTITTNFKYENADDFYNHFTDLSFTSKYLKFKVDDVVVAYRCDDISCIKIRPIETNK